MYGSIVFEYPVDMKRTISDMKKKYNTYFGIFELENLI